MAMTSVQAPLFTILENHARPPVIGQEHDYPHPQHTRQTLVGHPVKDSTMSCSEEPGGGDRPPSEKPPLPPKPSTVESVMSPTSPSINTTEETTTHQSPKLSEKSAKPTGIESSPPTGSETSRSFHPEGSIDLSPSCSESLPTTPSYLKWAENMQYLLDDGDGCTLFKVYLDQQSLGHLLEFVLAVKGFKIQIADQASADPEMQFRLIKTINKRYVNSLGKNLRSRLECLSGDQRRSLDEKITTKLGLDVNIFDGLYQTVLEHLESKCYPNFLTSEIYIEHVQSYPNQESDVTSLKYQSSTASSVCGHQSKTTIADDSGISGITEKTNNNPPSVTSPECIQISSSTSCSVSHILPTVKEDSELSISSATLSQSNKSASASSYGARPKAASMSKSLSALPSKPGVTESHPVVPLSSSSYPYHAHSSNWNPVSRQDSELQSQSSGAAHGGGDTTDTDNYSTFHPPVEPTVRSRHVRNTRKVTHQPTSTSHIPREVKEVKNKESSQFIPRPKIPIAEPYSKATNNPPKFAAELIERLNKVLIKQSSDCKLKGILDLNKTKSSTYEYEHESDQSILDEHVDRVFNEERRHNVSSMNMDNSRMMSASFSSGYRTLDTSSNRHHHSYFGAPPAPATSHSQYRHPNMAGDLAYYPAPGKNNPNSKSFSDTGFGMPAQPAMRMPTSQNQYAFQQSHGSDRVADWLKTTNQVHIEQQPAFVKTSPRGSGRHQKRTRSQDRYGLQQQQQQQAQQQHQYMASMSSYGHFMGNPTINPASINEATRRLTRQNQGNPNQSLPVTTSNTTTSNSSEFTTAKYLFPSSKDNTPFLVKIPKLPPITLNDVKQCLPKKGVYRFYFKTEVDGEAVFQEENEDGVSVPLWKGTVTVQCSDCGLL